MTTYGVVCSWRPLISTVPAVRDKSKDAIGNATWTKRPS